MGNKTSLDWRERPDEEPDADFKALRKHIEVQRKNPDRIADKETFLLIEHCQNWYEAYLREKQAIDNVPSPCSPSSPPPSVLRHDSGPIADH